MVKVFWFTALVQRFYVPRLGGSICRSSHPVGLQESLD